MIPKGFGYIEFHSVDILGAKQNNVGGPWRRGFSQNKTSHDQGNIKKSHFGNKLAKKERKEIKMCKSWRTRGNLEMLRNEKERLNWQLRRLHHESHKVLQKLRRIRNWRKDVSMMMTKLFLEAVKIANSETPLTLEKQEDWKDINEKVTEGKEDHCIRGHA